MKKYTSAIVFALAIITATGAAVGAIIGTSQSVRAQPIPDVSTQSAEVAEKTLEAQGLIVEKMYASSAQPVGTVFKQVPEAGTALHRGQRVQIYVVLNNLSAENSSPDVLQSQEPQVQAPEQQQTTLPQQQNGQPSQQQNAAQRKAEIARQIAEANAAAAAAKQKATEELARIAAEQARVDALYNAMVAAQSEVTAARYALERANFSVNDFAARGMLQSSGGERAIAELNQAQIRYDNSLVAASNATTAWQSR